MKSLPSQRTCRHCGKTKDLEANFRRKAKSPGGRDTLCHPCENRKRRSYRKGMGDDLEIPLHIKRESQRNAILRMYSQGIASKEFCKDALERIK